MNVRATANCNNAGGRNRAENQVVATTIWRGACGLSDTPPASPATLIKGLIMRINRATNAAATAVAERIA